MISVHFRYPQIYRPLLDSITLWSQIRLDGFEGQTIGLSYLDGFESKRHKKIDMSKHADFLWLPLLDSNQRPAD